MAEILVPTAGYPTMFLGLPWYIWAIVLLVVALFLTLGFFIYYRNQMGPCRAYRRAKARGDDLGILGKKSGQLKFIDLEYFAEVFRNAKLNLSWIQRTKESWRFGACNAKILMDFWGIASEPKLLEAVKVAVIQHNANEDAKVAEAASKGEQYTATYIRDYGSLYDAVVNGVVKDPILIPSVYEVPTWEVRHFLENIGPADFKGHVDALVAEEKGPDKTAGDIMKAYMPVIVGMLVVVVAVYLFFGVMMGGA